MKTFHKTEMHQFRASLPKWVLTPHKEISSQIFKLLFPKFFEAFMTHILLNFLPEIWIAKSLNSNIFLKEIKNFFFFRGLLTVYHCYVSKWVCLQFLFNLPTYILMWFHNSLFFSIFYKSQCTAASDSTFFGTCYAETECSSKGGTVDGNCAAGFGVCCTFV